ncbi:MAG: hypothetical protein ACRD5H_08055, partial [Nitrososphaerales archaeon]
MTLILTALSPEHVVQVSDRRVVWREPSGEIKKTEDERIKAIITPYFACSYSGLAELGKGDTAKWIGIELSDHICDTDRGISALTSAVEKQVHKQKFTGRPLTIMCAGWFSLSDDPIKSRAVAISNFDENTGRVLNKFSTLVLFPQKGRDSTVIPKGQPLHSRELLEVNWRIENLCKSKRATSRTIAQVLVECVRSVARSSDRKASVSEEVLVTCLPRYDRLKGLLVVGKLVEDFWSVTCFKGGTSM